MWSDLKMGVTNLIYQNLPGKNMIFLKQKARIDVPKLVELSLTLRKYWETSLEIWRQPQNWL